MIINGGTVFIRIGDQLPELTIRNAKVVMDVSEPATMESFSAFLSNHLAGGSDVRYCAFYTLESWAEFEAIERIGIAKAGARNDAAPGWGRRIWQRITGQAST